MSDLAARAVGSDQVRKRGLQLGIAPHQRVIFGVADFGRIFGVIEPVMMRYLAREAHQFVGSIGFGRNWARHGQFSSIRLGGT